MALKGLELDQKVRRKHGRDCKLEDSHDRVPQGQLPINESEIGYMRSRCDDCQTE